MPLASEIYHEGLRIPPIKVVRRGEFDDDLLQLTLANVRTPDERRGDLGAQLAAHHVGERRLLEATAKYGPEKIRWRMADLKDYAERIMRARIAAIPDGDYEFADVLDDDGFSDTPLRIACTICIAGETAAVDFSDSDPQTRGGVNANRAVTISATMYVFRCLIPEAVPYNAGLMRPIEVLTRPGSIVDAQAPASVAAGNVETSQRLVDVLLGALAQALPEVVPAASSGTMNNVALGGVDPTTGKPFAYYETIAGAMGATAASDGLSGVHTHMTNSLNTPVEALEQTYPLLIREYSIRQGSGGKGVHNGGDGVIRDYEFLADTDVTLLSERR
jgi:N-methylhydantoinase B